MAKFMVQYSVSGSFSEVIEAEDEDAAKALVEAKAYDDEFTADLDEVDDVNFTIQLLHPVIREGQRLLTTHVRATDGIPKSHA